MLPDLTPILTRYEALRAEADSVFTRVQSSFPDCVTCTKGCSDCCYALFDLSLVEALALNRAFMKAFNYGEQRSKILTRASETDRKLTKLKRSLFQMEKNGSSPDEIMKKAAEERMACPLLEDGTCLLYDDRPITCRLYGIPTVIGDRGHVCGFSKFDVGAQYPTVRLDTIQSRLEALSGEIAQAVQSRFTELDQVYVPVSMALLNRYDETYLGCGKVKDD